MVPRSRNTRLERLKHVDLLVSQEPKDLAQPIMLGKNAGYISPAIDQLDGLTKPLHDWNVSFYGRKFNAIYRLSGKPIINYPNEQYILHLAQIVPNEGTICLLDAYRNFYHRRQADSPHTPVPKFLTCHSRSPNNDNDAPIYTSVLTHIKDTMPDLAQSISIAQLQPQDQLWNVLISKALAIVQFNDPEGIPEMLLGVVQKWGAGYCR
ncbi:hypothetical protein BDW59DRAFT_163871 [Aspergillus cavernicola]|uniref:HNH nuclease domain-containing protein n=1 Tax=Aspergillus cavernicola TaxID=176166 RepID=A0ABR4I3U9_9EURO